MSAFAKGLKHLGVKVNRVTLKEARPSPTTPMVCWGVWKKKLQKRRGIHALQKAQRDWGGELVIMERGFIKREDYYVLSYDDLNNRGTWPHDAVADVPSDRWDKLGVHYQDWRRDDKGQILIIGQVPWDTSCQHVDFEKWVHSITEKVRERYPNDVRMFRPHPLYQNASSYDGLAVHGIGRDRSLSKALQASKLVVVFSSTVGVDALLAGVPTVACDRTSMVHRISSHTIEEEVKTPDRKRWANWLAYCQWNLEEMRRGEPWLHFHPELA